MQGLDDHTADGQRRNSDVSIAAARLSDAVTIARMSRDLIEYGLPWSWRPARIAWQIGSRDTVTRVARHADGPLVGFALARLYDDYARLMLLAVCPAWQKRDIGRGLVDDVQNACVALGCPTLHLEARLSNGAGLAFYRRLGFSALVDIPHYYVNGENARHLYRHIDADAG